MARHHYVPQFYLRYFSLSGTKDKIYTYRRQQEPFLTEVNAVAAINDFNSYIDSKGKKNDFIERVFSDIEGKVKTIIDRFIRTNSTSMTEKERGDLSFFIASLHTRNEAFRKQSKASYISMLKVLSSITAQSRDNFSEDLKTAGVKVDEKEAEDIRQDLLNQNYDLDFENEDYFLGHSLKLSNEIFPYVFNKDYHILNSDGTRVFFTSDNPVTIKKPSNISPHRGNGGFRGGLILLPLSPSHCLFLKNPGSPAPNTVLDRQLIDSINYNTSFYTDIFAFSNLKSKDIQDTLNLSKEEDSGSVEVTYQGKRKVYKPPQKKQKRN